MARGRFDVAGLVVEEEVRLKLAQELAFVQATQEHRLIDLDVPVHQGTDGALVRRGAACRYQCSADAHARGRRLLQAVQRHQERLERAIGQGLGHLVELVLLKGRKSLRLVDLFGLIAEQHGVAVEGNAHFVRVGVAGVGRLRVHLGCRHTGKQRRAHVAQVGAQEQIGAQGLEVAPRGLAARERAADDGQGVVRRRLHHAQAAHRVVA